LARGFGRRPSGIRISALGERGGETTASIHYGPARLKSRPGRCC